MERGVLLIEAPGKVSQVLDTCGVERLHIAGGTIEPGLSKQTDITFTDIQPSHEVR